MGGESFESEFEKFWDNNKGLIHKIACKYSIDGMEIDDVKQELALKLLSVVGDYDERTKLQTFFYRAGVNQLINILRRQSAEKRSKYKTVSLEEAYGVESESGVIDDILHAIIGLGRIERKIAEMIIDGFTKTEIKKELQINEHRLKRELTELKANFEFMRG
jgi:RNA polymerase sigma factor (sigma-70 family)